MKHFDFLSGARDEVFRLLIWGEGCSIPTFNLGRGMKYSDFYSGGRGEVFQLLLWGEGWSISTFNLGHNTNKRGPYEKGWKITKRQLVFIKGNMRSWREKVTFFWLKLIGGPLQKSLENHQKRNLCLWRAICAHEGKKWRFLSKTDRMPSTKKAGKSPKKTTCVYEGQYAPMKGKSQGFWLKLIGGPLEKRLENHQKSNLFLRRAICTHEGKKWRFLSKSDTVTKKAGKYQKKQRVFMKRNMWT